MTYLYLPVWVNLLRLVPFHLTSVSLAWTYFLQQTGDFFGNFLPGEENFNVILATPGKSLDKIGYPIILLIFGAKSWHFWDQLLCLPWTQYFSCTISALGLNTTVPTMERLCMVVLHFSVPFSASSKENKTGVFGFLSSLCLDCIESSLNFVLVYSSSFSFCTLGFGVSTFFSSTLGLSVTVQQLPDSFYVFYFLSKFLGDIFCSILV